MGKRLRGPNWSIDNEVSRALAILSEAERAALRDRFEIGQRITADNVVPLFGSSTRLTERRALRKLRSASLKFSLGQQEWRASTLGTAQSGPSIGQDWSVSHRWEAWLGGNGADWWDEA